MNKNQINKNTNIKELIEANPELNEVLYEYGLYCGACAAAGFDTLELGAQVHGLEEEEIDGINSRIKSNSG
jgi:hybrid cluster-associated redox disulfide protein